MRARIVTATHWLVPGGCYAGQLRTYTGALVWQCTHRHRTQVTASRCADRQIRRRGQEQRAEVK